MTRPLPVILLGFGLLTAAACKEEVKTSDPTPAPVIDQGMMMPDAAMADQGEAILDQGTPTDQSRATLAIPTDDGEAELSVIEHGSFSLAWKGETIYVDPVISAFEARGVSAASLPKADLILLTDIHPDHLDPAAVTALSKAETVIVAPEAVIAQAGEPLAGAKVMKNGDTLEVLDGALALEATPMYNVERKREDNGEPYHVKGRGNGYILKMGGKRIYVSGDTECTDEMKALQDIDVAFVTMNLPYTMPVEEAATCVTAFKPKTIIPFHYRGQDVSKLPELVRDAEGVTVELLDWYPAGQEQK